MSSARWFRRTRGRVTDGPRHEHAMSVLADITNRAPLGHAPSRHPDEPTGHVRLVGEARDNLPPVRPLPVARRETWSRQPSADVDPDFAVVTFDDSGPAGPLTNPPSYMYADARRRAPVWRALAAGGVVALLLVAGTASWWSRRDNGRAASASNSSRTVKGKPPADVKPAVATTPDAPTTAPAPTTTTAPVPVGVQVVRTGAASSAVVTRDGADLALTATSPCWVQVRSAAGQVVFVGTVQPGETQEFAVTPGASLRIGRTDALQLSLDGMPFTLPPAARTPLAVAFVAHG